MWRARSLDDLLDDCDGIVSHSELRSDGWDDEILRLLLGRGRIVRLRHGWYGAPGLHPDVRRAWAAGGPLACISALVHHGAVRADDPRHDPQAVHVSLPRQARHPTTLGLDVGDAVIVWHYSAGPIDTRRAVGIETARRQLARCAVRPVDKAAEVRRRAAEQERQDEERRARELAAAPPWGSS